MKQQDNEKALREAAKKIRILVQTHKENINAGRMPVLNGGHIN